MTVIRCPICKHSFKVEESKATPFCSDRCRNVDLGRWLNEEYSLPENDSSAEDKLQEFPQGFQHDG